MHDRRPKSNFCGLSASEQAKARGILPKRDMATNFGGLLMECYIYCRKPPKLVAISHRRIRSLVLHRIVAASGSLPQQNFDYEKRFAFFSAQDDIQRFYLAVCVEKSVGERKNAECRVKETL